VKSIDTWKVFKDWLVPVIAVVIAATGTWIRFEEQSKRHEKEIADLKHRMDGYLAHSIDGFCHPEVIGALDLHFRSRWEPRVLTKSEWIEWRKQFFMLNSTLDKPVMDRSRGSR